MYPISACTYFAHRWLGQKMYSHLQLDFTGSVKALITYTYMEALSLCHPFSFFNVVRYTHSGQNTAETEQSLHFYLRGLHFSSSSLLTLHFHIPFSPLLINFFSQPPPPPKSKPKPKSSLSHSKNHTYFIVIIHVSFSLCRFGLQTGAEEVIQLFPFGKKHAILDKREFYVHGSAGISTKSTYVTVPRPLPYDKKFCYLWFMLRPLLLIL